MRGKGVLIGLAVLVPIVVATAIHAAALPSAILSPGSGAIVAEHPWPMFGHDARHTGRSPYVGPAWPRLKWRYQISCCGDVQSSPVIASDGTIYIGSSDGGLYAMRPDGTLRWKYATGSVIYAPPAIGSDGTVYVGGGDGMIALNSDGTFRWRSGPSLQVAPTVGANGVIYAVDSGSGFVYAISPDGSVRWRFETGDSVSSSPAEDATLGRVYVASRAGDLYAISLEGALQWRYATGASISRSPAIADDGTVYIGANDAYLYAVSPDGTLRWRYKADGSMTSSAAVGTEGTIYIGSYEGCLYAINPDGTQRWQYTTWHTAGGCVTSSPAIGADGTVYVGSRPGYLDAIRSDGTLRWQYQTGECLDCALTIGADGTLYVGLDDAYLYAIENGPSSTPTSAAPTPVPTATPPLRVNAMPVHDAWAGQPLVLWGNATGGSVALQSGALLYRWAFGDGTGVITGNVSDPRDITTTHTYRSPGTYTARLTVSATNGLDSDKVVIKVYDRSAVTDTLPVQVNMAVEEGLRWLYLNQDQGTGAWWPWRDPVAKTSEALLAFEVKGHLPDNDPDSDIYVETVRRGLDYLLSRAQTVAIEPQPAGDPDVNRNGLGIAVCGRGRMYEPGMFASALAASWAPNRVVTSGPLSGRTYADVMQDCVDFLAYAQTEAEPWRGGWRYAPNDNTSDNSVSQWPVLGLLGARLWSEHVTVPSFVDTELERWVSYIQSEDGGSGYEYPGISNVPRTGGLLIEMAYLGDDAAKPRVQRALDWLGDHWNAQPGEEPGSGTGGNKGNLYAMYGVKKGLQALNVDRIPLPGESGGLDWYRDYAAWLVQQQEQDGRWEPGSVGENQDDYLTTAWALLILEPTIFGEPPERPPVVEEYCCCEGDKIYRIDTSRFYGYNSRSASDSALIPVTSPPAPVAWNQANLVPDAAWQAGHEVWWDAWLSPGWRQLPGSCRPVGLSIGGIPEGRDGATHLYRHTFVLSPPEEGGRVTSAVLEMWSDNKTEWWWQGRPVHTGEEGYQGWVELFPGQVASTGGTYVLAAQNSNDAVCPDNCNAQGTACRLRVTWSFPSTQANRLYLPAILKALDSPSVTE